MKTVHYNGVTFYVDANADKTEQEFMDHEAHHGFTEGQLKEAYRLVRLVAPQPQEKPVPYVPSNKRPALSEND
jgi:hypothetical protein